MKHKAVLSLSSSECSRATDMGCEVIKGTTFSDGLYESTEVHHDNVTHLVKFLRTISDLRDYSDEELEENYVRVVK